MRIVVTGGAGFIGSAVCRMMVAERGATVLNLDKLTAASSLASLGPIAQSPRYSFRKTDVCDRERVAALLHAFAPDAIVHAAIEHHTETRTGTTPAAIETNVLGTWRMLEAARDYWSSLPARRKETFRFLSASTAGAPSSPATAVRAGADELVTAWHKSYGLPAIVAKAAATFGPYQFPGAMVAAAVTGTIDGAQIGHTSAEPAAWLYAEDHVRALLAMLERGTPGAVYQVAGRGTMAPMAMVERVRELVERHGARSASPSRHPAGPQPKLALAGEHVAARLEQDTGWRPEETVDTALSKTVRWYLANEAWWRPLAAAQSADNQFGLLKIA